LITPDLLPGIITDGPFLGHRHARLHLPPSGDLALGIVGVIIARKLTTALAGRFGVNDGGEQPILRGRQALVGGLR